MKIAAAERLRRIESCSAAHPAAILPLPWWKGQGQGIISCFILPELKSSGRCYLGLFVTVIQHSTTLHFRGHCLCLLFSVYIYSADLWAKRAHQFPSSTSCSSSSHALAFRRTGICHACDCNPVRFPVLHRERLESSWTDIWTSAATAARTVGVASTTAVTTTSPWVASTLGRTTTKEGESFVTLSCHATGGSHVCWAGSEEHCLGFHYRRKLSLWYIFQTTCENKAVHCQHLLIKLKVSPVGFSQTKWHFKRFDFFFFFLFLKPLVIYAVRFFLSLSTHLLALLF